MAIYVAKKFATEMLAARMLARRMPAVPLDVALRKSSTAARPCNGAVDDTTLGKQRSEQRGASVSVVTGQSCQSPRLRWAFPSSGLPEKICGTSGGPVQVPRWGQRKEAGLRLRQESSCFPIHLHTLRELRMPMPGCQGQRMF